jgi:hypothetical protein
MGLLSFPTIAYKAVDWSISESSVPTELAKFEVECDFAQMRTPHSQHRIKVVSFIYPVVHHESDL